MKYFKGILVVMLVFLFPLGSYLYLRSGFNFRKQALEILKERTVMAPESFALISKNSAEFSDRFYNGVTLIQKVQKEKDLRDLYFFAENLRVRPDFQLIGLFDENAPVAKDDTIYARTLSRIILPASDIDMIMSEQRFMLAKDSFVRKTYDVGIEETKDVYEHAVILLPVKKRDKIKLQRNKEI